MNGFDPAFGGGSPRGLQVFNHGDKGLALDSETTLKLLIREDVGYGVGPHQDFGFGKHQDVFSWSSP